MATNKLSDLIRQERTAYDNQMRKNEEDRIARERAAKLAEEERIRKLNRKILIIISSIIGPFILAGLIAVGNGHSFESGVIVLFSVIKWIVIIAIILLVIGMFSS